MWQDIFPVESIGYGGWLYTKHPRVIAVAVTVQASISDLVAGPRAFNRIPFRIAMAIYDHQLWQTIEATFLKLEASLASACLCILCILVGGSS